MIRARIVKNTVFLASMIVVSTAATSALAAFGPADDRMLTNKVGWAAAGSKAMTDLAPVFTADGDEFRLTDIHVRSESPLSFSTVAVRNVGAYHIDSSGISWFHGITLAEVQALKNDGRRVTVIREYNNGTDVHFIGVTVPMAGADNRDWMVLPGTISAPPPVPDGFRPAMVTSTIDPNGVREVALLVVKNPEGLTCHVNWDNTDTHVENVRDQNFTLLDAQYYDNQSMNSATIFCDPSDGLQGYAYFDADGLQDLFNNFIAGSMRPLFLTAEVLHGTGTADGDTQWLSSMVDNF